MRMSELKQVCIEEQVPSHVVIKVAQGTKEHVCHGTTSLHVLCPPLATSNPICLHSTSSASALLQLQSILAQLVQLHRTHSRTNCGSIPDPFRPGSHAKGHCLYT